MQNGWPAKMSFGFIGMQPVFLPNDIVELNVSAERKLLAQ